MQQLDLGQFTGKHFISFLLGISAHLVAWTIISKMFAHLPSFKHPYTENILGS